MGQDLSGPHWLTLAELPSPIQGHFDLPTGQIVFLVPR